ncbi:RNA polymerase factor sigma-54 [Parvularcula dongshanensis]|uniref:RNA polymerase sigma-54 factor n=1 Tax=Parvularcula dongshanensis TaxID=1173995 RepID=A0A840I5A3_9PROT|nr:RNA polymerase factor sigma-54 [Parvularcula dongshanensis]MBB4659348.1 RNA polymerase sigma-54 factor [Parvularcula dongshanensis]
MALTPKLDLRQGQQLVMTPQLQQAIKLLQLTNLELAEFVESQLEENPFLERDERANEKDRGEESRSEERRDADASADVSTLDTDYSNVDSDAGPGDAAAGDWSNVSGSRQPVSEDYDVLAQTAEEITLREHLTKQLHLATRDEVQLMIGAHLIDLIDDGGYLRAEVEEVAERLGAEPLFVRRALRLIQGFEPSGIAARSLAECLRLQLRDQNLMTPQMDLFLENIHYLGTHDLPSLRRACKFSEDDLREHIAAIRKLNPKPGLAYGRDTVQVVIPDVYVTEASDGGWKVELNQETLPKVIANERYFARMSSKSDGQETRSFLNEQMSNANWLVKSLDQRARTILKVALQIVKHQDVFLVEGISKLRPLNLKTIADAIDMHESTVSRVTSNKFIHTPRGVFEMKYFFTASIAAKHGEQSYSAESVRQRIRELIGKEDPHQPLSDDRLVEVLAAENVDIARRTVAKYREALGVPSSVQRKRMAKRAI